MFCVISRSTVQTDKSGKLPGEDYHLFELTLSVPSLSDKSSGPRLGGGADGGGGVHVAAAVD